MGNQVRHGRRDEKTSKTTKTKRTRTFEVSEKQGDVYRAIHIMLVEAFGEEFSDGDGQAFAMFMVKDECLDPKKGRVQQNEICRLFKLALLREQERKRIAGKLKGHKRGRQTGMTRVVGREEGDVTPEGATKKKEGEPKNPPAGGVVKAVPSQTPEPIAESFAQ